jgi:hypothetical protein
MNEFWEGIEEPIRDIVRLLRDNGINTTCSCGHDMHVEIELGNHMDEVERIAGFLWDNGYKVFKIECTLRAPSDGFWDRRATIHFNKWM